MTVAATPAFSEPVTVVGGVNTYTFDFDAYVEEDVRVQVTGLTGLLSYPEYMTDYTVDFVALPAYGGTVTITLALPVGAQVVLFRDTGLAQATQLPNQGPFFAATVERALDRLTMVTQDQAREADLSLSYPVGSLANARFPVPVVGKAVVGRLVDGVPTYVADGPDLGDLSAAVAATAADRVQTGLDRVATGQDRVQTGLDRVATGQDKVATAADRVQTGLDKVATAADHVQTGLDRVATGQDKTATAADRVVTTADRVQTGLDKAATAADRVQTGLDKVATAADRVQTGLDKVATAADRVVTTSDRAATTAALAAATLPGVPVALNYLRRNAGNTAYEVRTPAQTAADIAALRYDAAQGLTSPQVSQALDNLGISALVKTLLDDTTALAFEQTLGALVNTAAVGYVKLPGTGIYIQWGNATLASGTVNFPVSFPNACRAVVATVNANGQRLPAVSDATQNNFSLRMFSDLSGSTASANAYFIAIGY